MENHIYDFVGSEQGQWKVQRMQTIKGASLAEVPYLSIRESSLENKNLGIWTLKGLVSNLRYAEKDEREKLIAVQEGLGRPQASCAALIPIRKSETWWNMAQDERRKIFEAKSHHTEVGLKYLPAIARKLFHCRDISQPFDFLTWFEFAPEHSDAFDDLLLSLRNTEEWEYIDREIEIRLIRM